MAPHYRPAERRRSPRFAVQEQLCYSIVEGQNIIAVGTGVTTDLSSSGVAFTTQQSLKPGTFVELSIKWPNKAGGVPTILVGISGRIVRADAGIAACAISQYEYRIQNEAEQTAPNVLPPFRQPGLTHPW